ncbi:MAG TPA: single-stranded DNA-binding protein, partial [Cyanobacteria bacterium UBA11368]|nr:single-stranded DNA-binding protein [Cyanobacteria bacterium UBA11368]
MVQSSVPVENVAVGSTQITDDLNKLLDILPAEIRQPLEKHHMLNRLVEVVMDLGRRPEARFPGKTEYLSEKPVSREDLN